MLEVHIINLSLKYVHALYMHIHSFSLQLFMWYTIKREGFVFQVTHVFFFIVLSSGWLASYVGQLEVHQQLQFFFP